MYFVSAFGRNESRASSSLTMERETTHRRVCVPFCVRTVKFNAKAVQSKAADKCEVLARMRASGKRWKKERKIQLRETRDDDVCV